MEDTVAVEVENSVSDDNAKTIDKEVEVMPQTSQRKSSYSQLLMAILLLFGVIMFGITISIIGNDEFIKAHFAVLQGYDVAKTYDAELFPAWIWSFGFLFPLGGLIGSFAGAMTVDRFGRKIPSMAFCVCLMIGAITKFLSRYTHSSLLFVGRCFDGIGAAGFMVTLVLLVLETIHKSVENIFKPLIQTFINLGIVMIGALTLYRFAGFNWNLVFLATIIFPIIVLITLIFYPESPKYVYVSTRDAEKTRKIFKQLRGEFYDESEFEELQKIVSQEENIKQMTITELLTQRYLRLSVISLIFLHIGQQLSGINAIIAFSPSLLKDAGFEHPDLGGLMIASVGFVGSIFFGPFVSRVKRKILWISSFALMAISFVGYLVSVSLKWNPKLNVFFLCMFVFVFQLGAGSVVWFISMEMFPSNAVGAAQGVASFFNWLANTLVYFLVPILNDKIKEKSLIIFLVFQILIIIYSFFILEETFNKKPAEVLEAYDKTMTRFCGRTKTSQPS